MNDIDKMPSKCRDCPYWELASYPWCCGDCKDRLKKPVSDFVSRQWLIDEYHQRHEGPPGGALKMIEEAPAADVEPKRKTGRWKIAGAFEDFYQCPECGEMWPIFSTIEWKCCPVCECHITRIPEPPKEEEK